MKKNKLLRKIAALTMLFAIVFGVFGVQNNAIKADAATDKVKMYYADMYGNVHGASYNTFYIQVNDNAQNKQVYLHYTAYPYPSWSDMEALYVATLSDGSQIWKAGIVNSTVTYAVKYVGDGQTYWDNNNGNNYTLNDELGSAPIKVNTTLNYDYSNFKVETTLKNLAYTKVVKVRYTEDDWATYRDVSLSYNSSNTSKGTEVWSATLSLDSSKLDHFQYCVYYQVNGETYWDNNFGSNFNRNNLR